MEMLMTGIVHLWKPWIKSEVIVGCCMAQGARLNKILTLFHQSNTNIPNFTHLRRDSVSTTVSETLTFSSRERPGLATFSKKKTRSKWPVVAFFHFLFRTRKQTAWTYTDCDLWVGVWTDVSVTVVLCVHSSITATWHVSPQRCPQHQLQACRGGTAPSVTRSFFDEWRCNSCSSVFWRMCVFLLVRTKTVISGGLHIRTL